VRSDVVLSIKII